MQREPAIRSGNRYCQWVEAEQTKPPLYPLNFRRVARPKAKRDESDAVRSFHRLCEIKSEVVVRAAWVSPPRQLSQPENRVVPRKRVALRYGMRQSQLLCSDSHIQSQERFAASMRMLKVLSFAETRARSAFRKFWASLKTPGTRSVMRIYSKCERESAA